MSTGDLTPCPHCGHCPTCGRSNAPYPLPYYVPYYVPIVPIAPIWPTYPTYSSLPQYTTVTFNQNAIDPNASSSSYMGPG